MWASVAMASGALAVFLVTRAGGVWAMSVHFRCEFIRFSTTDVFRRIMVLLSDNSGIEVIVYAWEFFNFLEFLATRLGHEYSKYWLALLPAIAVLGVIGGRDVLDGFPQHFFSTGSRPVCRGRYNSHEPD